MRYKITLSYDGSAFCGWQLQPSDPSVQGELEHALSTLLRLPVQVVGAGRTDTAVNAVNYVAHFDLPDDCRPDCKQLMYKLNAILSHSVSVSALEETDDDFHARFGARKRVYRYFIHRKKDPFVSRYSYHCGYPELDFELMNKAAESLLGTHDFSCFEKLGSDNKTSICTVVSAAWHQYRPVVAANQGECYWYFEIAADRFLRNMVRATVGTLLEVGRGKRSREDFESLILPVDPAAPSVSRRSLAGESVPGNALFLADVDY